MDKLKILNRIADYIRVNGSLAPVSINDIFHLDSSHRHNTLAESDIYIMLECLIDLKLIEESYSAENYGKRQFLWIGDK